jgi:hypothetical protein
MVMFSHCVRLLVAALALVVVVGCGGSGVKKVSVTGSVSLDGTPLEKGTITFVPADKSAQGGTAGGEITNGKFSVATVSAGKNRVTIEEVHPVKTATSYEEHQAERSKMMQAAINKAAGMKEKRAMDAQRKISDDTAGNNQTIDVPPAGLEDLNIKLENTKKK